MKTLFRLFLSCLIVSCVCGAQDLRSHMDQMKTAYTASGSIVPVDSQTLVVEPNMPAPVCALPRQEDGKIAWYRYAFPLSSITVALTDVDESLIGEDSVFTNPNAPSAYKPGDQGDAVMVVVVGMPGKKFPALIYDREKLAHLGPGPHSSSDYGQVKDQVEAFGLTFHDAASAHAFIYALKNAVILAKTQAMAR
ncbi:hypothetical protein P8935_03075 [Telmatobacter sp. DSM 110680]|uniref:Uncharacterized protein n=1 Tax=Telmatobacter sp. DSM 110680 TaxID=3036704 RepID=A0AAU7DLY2_9BACT